MIILIIKSRMSGKRRIHWADEGRLPGRSEPQTSLKYVNMQRIWVWGRGQPWRDGMYLGCKQGWVTKGWTSQNIDRPTGWSTETTIYRAVVHLQGPRPVNRRARQWFKQKGHLPSKEALCRSLPGDGGVREGGRPRANLISLRPHRHPLRFTDLHPFADGKAEARATTAGKLTCKPCCLQCPVSLPSSRFPSSDTSSHDRVGQRRVPHPA